MENLSLCVGIKKVEFSHIQFFSLCRVLRTRQNHSEIQKYTYFAWIYGEDSSHVLENGEKLWDIYTHTHMHRHFFKVDIAFTWVATVFLLLRNKFRKIIFFFSFYFWRLVRNALKAVIFSSTVLLVTGDCRLRMRWNTFFRLNNVKNSH